MTVPFATPTKGPSPPRETSSLELLNLKRLISTAELAHLAGVSASSVRRWRDEDPQFPRARILGDRTLRWRLGEVLDWLDSRPMADDPKRTDKALQAGPGTADHHAQDAAAKRYLDQPLMPGPVRRR